MVYIESPSSVNIDGGASGHVSSARGPLAKPLLTHQKSQQIWKLTHISAEPGNGENQEYSFESISAGQNM